LGSSSALLVTGQGTNATLIAYTGSLGGGFGSMTVPSGYRVLDRNGQVMLRYGFAGRDVDPDPVGTRAREFDRRPGC